MQGWLREQASIALAKKAGVYKGRKPSLTAEQGKEIRGRVKTGERKNILEAEYGVSRQTLYSVLA
jgi:DNA invertase Pin-like site-specific DNA recombinase